MACNHIHSRVVDSRKDIQNGSINRTRICEKCGLRFYTIELLAGSQSSDQVLKLSKQVNQLENQLSQIRKIIGG